VNERFERGSGGRMHYKQRGEGVGRFGASGAHEGAMVG
jgi:hypothetical protein